MHLARTLSTFIGSIVLIACVGAAVIGCGVSTEIPSTMTAASARPDVNGDGLTTPEDLDAASDAFGTRDGDPGFLPEADVNGDGVIGLSDLQALVQSLDG